MTLFFFIGLFFIFSTQAYKADLDKFLSTKNKSITKYENEWKKIREENICQNTSVTNPEGCHQSSQNVKRELDTTLGEIKTKYKNIYDSQQASVKGKKIDKDITDIVPEFSTAWETYSQDNKIDPQEKISELIRLYSTIQEYSKAVFEAKQGLDADTHKEYQKPFLTNNIITKFPKKETTNNSDNNNKPDSFLDIFLRLLKESSQEKKIDLKEAIQELKTERTKIVTEQSRLSALSQRANELSLGISSLLVIGSISKSTNSVDMSEIQFWKKGSQKNKKPNLISDSEDSVVSRIINIMTRVLGTVGILGIIVGSYFFLLSDGEENNIQRGKDIMIYSILGVFIGYLSYIIITFLVSVLFSVGG